MHHDATYKTVHHDPVYKTVHHDAVYQQQTVTKEGARSGERCLECGAVHCDHEEHIQHMYLVCDNGRDCLAYDVCPGQVTENVCVQNAYDENVLVTAAYDEKVQASAAYDETVTTGYKCSGCGATK